MDGAARPVHPPCLVGRVLGGTYRVVQRLDEGGMGVVFEAEHLRLRRRVAVKMLSTRHESNPALQARFEQEAEMIGRIEHPHVVGVLDFDMTEGREAYLVMELLRGETLEARLRRQSPLPVEEAVEITTQLASALTATHRAAVVHRDVKPSNVFLTSAPGARPFAKLLDFGISKNLRSSCGPRGSSGLVGTPEYMAPEQASGAEDLVGGRTDQCALALVAYEMLTGTQPFLHDDVSEVLRRARASDVPPASSVAPWLPVEMDEVLKRAMAKDPRARFDDVSQFARRLAAAARGVGCAWPAPPSRSTSEGESTPTGYARTMPSIAPPACRSIDENGLGWRTEDSTGGFCPSSHGRDLLPASAPRTRPPCSPAPSAVRRRPLVARAAVENDRPEFLSASWAERAASQYGYSCAVDVARGVTALDAGERPDHAG